MAPIMEMVGAIFVSGRQAGVDQPLVAIDPFHNSLLVARREKDRRTCHEALGQTADNESGHAPANHNSEFHQWPRRGLVRCRSLRSSIDLVARH